MAVTTSRIMLTVTAALLPGIAAMTYVWGLGVLWNAAICIGLVFVVEVIMLSMRGKPLVPNLRDGTALVTALLIAICLPPWMPLWPVALAALAAVGLAKHAYGGLGHNIFNPAMVGFAVVVVSYPELLSQWGTDGADALTGATVLTEFRYREGITAAEFARQYSPALGESRLAALAFGAGGIALIALKIIHWRIPLALMLGTAVGALFGYDQGSSLSHGSVTFHLFAGGTLAAAFFVATDPVTHPLSARAQWIYAALIGLLIYTFRAYSAYPDGIAFAVLLANCTAPLLNRYDARRTRRVEMEDAARG